MGWRLVGKRVAFTKMPDKGGKYQKGGPYAEYCVTNAFQCAVLDDDIGFE